MGPMDIVPFDCEYDANIPGSAECFFNNRCLVTTYKMMRSGLVLCEFSRAETRLANDR